MKKQLETVWELSEPVYAHAYARFLQDIARARSVNADACAFARVLSESQDDGHDREAADCYAKNF